MAEEVDYWPDLPDIPAEKRIVIHLEHPHLELDPDLAERLAVEVVGGESERIGRVDIILTDAKRLRGLNRKWRGADYDTDVLSFPLGDGSRMEGEIYVSLDFAREHCRIYGASFIQESCRYIVHGLLHLMGYEDHTPEARRIMRAKEDVYLRRTGVNGT